MVPQTQTGRGLDIACCYFVQARANANDLRLLREMRHDCLVKGRMSRLKIMFSMLTSAGHVETFRELTAFQRTATQKTWDEFRKQKNTIRSQSSNEAPCFLLSRR